MHTLSLQLSHMLLLFISFPYCIGQNLTTIYVSSTNTSIHPTTSNIYTTTTSISSETKSLWTQIIQYELGGWNILFISICALLLLCTFCCVFGFFCCQHLSRRRMYKNQIQHDDKKASMDIREDDDENDIHIAMNTAESNTITSTFDNNTHPNIDKDTNNTNDIFHKHSENVYNTDPIGIGSPKHYEHIKSNPQNPSNTHKNTIQSPKTSDQVLIEMKEPVPLQQQNDNNNGRYSRRSTKQSEHITDNELNSKQNETKHNQIPSNLAAGMEMAQFIRTGSKVNAQNSDNSTTNISSDDTENEEKSNLVRSNDQEVKPNTRKMRSYSHRTASLDNFNKDMAYDDMTNDPQLAKYRQKQSRNASENAAYRQVQHNETNNELEEEDTESDTTTSSDDSTDEYDEDTDTTSSSNEGTSSDDTSSDDEDDEDDDESKDGQGHDTTTSDFIDNFGNNMNMEPFVDKYMNKMNKSPKSRSKKKKTPRKTPKRTPKKQRDYNGNHKKIITSSNVGDDGDVILDKIKEEKIKKKNESESKASQVPKDNDTLDYDKEHVDEISDAGEDDDVLSPLKVAMVRKKTPKKHHVADDSDAFESMDDYDDVQKALKNDVNHDDSDFED